MGQEAGDMAPELGEEVDKSASWSAHAGPGCCRATAVLRGEGRCRCPPRSTGQFAEGDLRLLAACCHPGPLSDSLQVLL